MNLILVGLNHKTAPVEIRERVAFPAERTAEALNELRRDFGFEEALIVSTCNRVEVVGRPPDGCLRPDRLKQFFYDYHGLQAPCLEPYLYSYASKDTVRHVFRVASSLDSMVVGESQILRQLKEAYALASQAGTAGLLINSLMHRAFHVAKRVRTETRVAGSAISVSYVAVELARKILGELAGKRVLLVGAGKMGELAASNLVKCGISNVVVTNRTPAKAAELAERFSGTAVPFDRLNLELVSADIVIASTAAQEYVLTKPQMQKVTRERKYRPLFIIDISVPRNVDPAVNDIEDLFLYDIDDMQSVIQANLDERRKEAGVAENIVAEEVDEYARRAATRDIGALVATLRARLEEICLEELERNRAHMAPEEYERAARMARITAHRLAHPFIVQLKNPDSNLDRYQHEIDLIKKAFRLRDTQ